MNCCSNCFSSYYLTNIIDSDANVGNCDFCKSNDVNIYNSESLVFYLQGIVDLYELNPSGQTIENAIESDFPNQIFSKKLGAKSKDLLKEIFKDVELDYKDLLEQKVSLSAHVNKGRKKKSGPLQVTWEELAKELKYVNRFHLQNRVDLDKLERLLKRYGRTIKKGKKLYRSRLSDAAGYTADKMKNPPSDLAKGGRANPDGISYLYLSNNEETTLYESRATLFDYVSIGEFRLLEDIEIISLRGDFYDPILLADNGELEDFLIHQPFMNDLEKNLSKPKRRSDNKLDYLPTQYLSEFIKSIGFDGIEFQSSLYEAGYNLACFKPKLFDCIKVSVKEVHSLTLQHRSLI